MPEDHRLEVGAGISTGQAFVGNVGGKDVTDYTVLGDTVNVAARLQGAAAPGEILIAQETFGQIEKQFPAASGGSWNLRARAIRSSRGRSHAHDICDTASSRLTAAHPVNYC